jgi:hypothetical protein
VMGPLDSSNVELAEPRIIADKQKYGVGDTVRYRLEFYNPNQVPITFQAPKTMEFLVGFLGDNPELVTYDLSFNQSAVTIPPNGIFYPVEWMCEFTAERTGYYKITFGQSVLIVYVEK